MRLGIVILIVAAAWGCSNATSCAPSKVGYDSAVAGLRRASLTPPKAVSPARIEVAFELGSCCGWAMEKQAYYHKQNELRSHESRVADVRSEGLEKKEIAFIDFNDLFIVPLYGTLHNEPENMFPETLRRYKLLARVLHLEALSTTEERLTDEDQWVTIKQIISQAREKIAAIDSQP